MYYQPPPSVLMQYPAIIYSLSSIENQHADNYPYITDKQYQIILIDKNPDSIFVDGLNQLPYAKMIRTYAADNLNHWVFEIYF